MASQTIGSLKTLLTADSSQFEATLTRAAKRGHVFAVGLTGAMKVAGAAFDFASQKAAQFKDYVWEGAKLAGEGQQKTASLALALRQVKDAADFKLNGQSGLAAFVSLADELEAKTNASAESILDLQAQFARAGASSKDIEKATRAALDMSVAMGQAPTVAARKMLGAMKGATEGLARYGLEMEKVEKGSKKSLGDVAKEIDRAFGGAAEKKAQTFTGRFEAITNALENLQKAVGGVIVRNAAFNKGMEIARTMIDRVTQIAADMGPEIGQGITYAMGVLTTFTGWLISAGADLIDWGTEVGGTIKIIGIGILMFASKAYGAVIELTGKVAETVGKFFKGYAAVLSESFIPATMMAGKAIGIVADGVISLGAKAKAGGKDLQGISEQLAADLKAEIENAPKREAAVKRVTDKARALGEAMGLAGDQMRSAAGNARELTDNLDTPLPDGGSPVDPDKVKEAAKALRDLLAAGDPFREMANRQADTMEEWDKRLEQGLVSKEQHAMALAKIDRNTADAEKDLIKQRTNALKSAEEFITGFKRDALDTNLKNIQDAYDAEIEKLRELVKTKQLTEEEFQAKKVEIDAAAAEQRDRAIEEEQARWAQAGIQFAQALANGIKGYMDSKDPKDLFKGLISGLIAILPMIVGAAGGGPLAMALIPGMAGIGAGFMHSGGTAKTRATPRLFHSGYSPPSAGEIDARLQTGEGVLSRAAMSRIGPEEFAALANGYGSRGTTTVINNNTVAFDAPAYASSVDRIGDRVTVQRINDRRGSEQREAVQKMVRPARHY